MNNSEIITEIPKENQPVSRSLVLTLAPASEIYNYFMGVGGVSDSDSDRKFSFLRFLLAKKSSQEKGGERWTFFGGKLDPYEDYEEAAQREVIEELGLTGIPHGDRRLLRKRLRRELKNPFNKNEGVYSYSLVINGESICRTVHLTAFFVLPCGGSDEDLIGGLIGDKKIREVVIVSLSDLKRLIEGGQFDGLFLEEHLRLSESDPSKNFDSQSGIRFSISQDNIEKRAQVFRQALAHLSRIEAFLERRFTDIFKANENLTLEDFQKIYHQEVIRFMRRGLERSLERKRVQSQDLENEEAKKIYEGLNGAFLGNDVLYFMPMLLSRLLEGKNIDPFLNETTEATGAFFRYFFQLKKSFFKERGIPDDRNYFQDINISHKEKDELIAAFNQYVKEALIRDFKITDKEMDLTFAYFNNFWLHLEENLKTADKSLHEGLIQNYRLMNEVSGAPLGKLILLFLGTFQYQNPESKKYQLQMMFEAGRQLLLLMKGFLSVRYFHEHTHPDKIFAINSIVENLFTEPVHQEIIKRKGIKGLYSILVRKIKIKIGEKDAECFIVDKKPPKSWLSFLRKSFKEKPENIRDFFSYSLVYAGNNPENLIESLMNDSFARSLETYFSQNYPKLNIIIKKTPSYGLQGFKEGKKEMEGKRTGSQGKRILAVKYIIEVGDQQIELVVYPYLSSKEAEVDEGGFWMGWLEKRADDQDYVVRRMLAGENGIPSFYDLLFPPEIYPLLYQERLRSNYHR